MKWAFQIKRKMSAAILLAVVFVTILVKNVVDNKYVTQLGTSFSSVYEDRLVVESYIYKLSDHLFRKKIMLDTCATESSANAILTLMNSHDQAIRDMIISYERTKLTTSESAYFNNLKANLDVLTQLERAYLREFDKSISPSRNAIDIEFNDALKNLSQLSGIQVSEGKLLNEHSKKIIAGSFLLTKFETGMMITIGLIIMALILEAKPVLPVIPGNQNLN